MTVSKFFLLTFFIILAVDGLSTAADYSTGNGFTASAGMEYQTISQGYYDAVIKAVIDTTSQDILELTESLSRATEQVNDLYFKSNLGYNYRGLSDHLNFLSDFEFSRDRFIGRFTGTYSTGNTSRNLEINGQFENKTPYDSKSETESGYNNYDARLTGRLQTTPALTLIAETEIEHINYTSLAAYQYTESDGDTIRYSSYNYDYTIYAGKIGGSLKLSDYSDWLYWYVTYRHRIVPDSAEANYDNFRLSGEYSGFGDYGNISIWLEGEYKDYNISDRQDDFAALYFSGNLLFNLSESWKNYWVLKIDRYFYTKEDLVNRNNVLIRPEFKIQRQIGDLQIGPVLGAEIRREDQSLDYSEDYNQFSGGIGASYFSLNGLFVDSEILFGRRKYTGTISLISDYNFWSVSLLAGYELKSRISLDLMFDGEFENPDEARDDSDIYLFSIALTAHL